MFATPAGSPRSPRSPHKQYVNDCIPSALEVPYIQSQQQNEKRSLYLSLFAAAGVVIFGFVKPLVPWLPVICGLLAISIVSLAVYRFWRSRKNLPSLSLNSTQLQLLGLPAGRSKAALPSTPAQSPIPLSFSPASGLSSPYLSPLSPSRNASALRSPLRGVDAVGGLNQSFDASALAPSMISQDSVLDDFLVRQQLRDDNAVSVSESAAAVANSLTQFAEPGAAPVLTYRTAYRAQPAGDRNAGDDAAASLAAQQWQENAGILGKMPLWTENLRKWLARKVVGPLARSMEDVDNWFGQRDLSYLQVNQPLVSSQIAQQRLAELKHVYRTQPDVQHAVNSRNLIELYLNVRGSASREYIISRIKVLAEGGFLSGYKWDGGGQSWMQELPTDSTILFHLFSTFIDSMMPPDPRAVRGSAHAFSSQHIVVHPEKPSTDGLGGADLVIHQTRLHTPHFKVIVKAAIRSQKDTILQTHPGRNSLFHAIVIFVLKLRELHDGYLGPVSISGKSIDLMSVIENI